MSNYREIVTKAIVGKAKKYSSDIYKMTTEEMPNTILGCWVINNTFNGVNNKGNVQINGTFDVNVWYSYDNDTKTSVSTKKFSYEDKMNVPLQKDVALDNSSEIIVRSLKQPTVSNVDIKDGVVELKIEKEMGVEIVGNTKVKISVEDYEDEYDEVYDDLTKEIDNINEEYLDTKEE